ncbi:MAG: hypothetical protein BWY09_02121 [Candidatus Hydrogenedentes bacterium ADurb.Bin179]|nr:MAG: hypothetical protein BWY09_02121 [Candidatus Hydrogenedentes bacterium ADurb.Bin179]
MWRAHRCGFEYAVLHDASGQESLENAQDITVGHFLGDALHDDLVRDVIEEAFDVGVEDMQEPLAVGLQRPFDGFVTVPVWPEAVGVFVKQGLEYGFQQAAQYFLRYTVTNDRYAQRSRLVRARRAFGNVNTA